MSQHSTNGSTTRGGSLTNAVSSLVRAQYGLASRAEAGESSTDLDKHVADLLLAEAKEREARAKASQSYTSWSFSDDEDGSGKQYTSKTNKRFLKNMLKGVEEHNAPLRRKEDSPSMSKPKESLDEIRRREREARERRLGITDAQRIGSSTETNAKSGDRKAGPGFAARMLATGLSGAVAAREDRARKDKDVEKAVEDARDRAEKDRHGTSAKVVSSGNEQKAVDYKGKGREREYSLDVDRRETAERRRSRSRERSKDRQGISQRRAKRDHASDSCGEEDRKQRRKHR